MRLDIEDYETRVRTGPCFICQFLAGTPGFEHEIVYDDGERVGFLNKFPTLPGSALVVPRRHVEDVVCGLAPPQYRALQSAVHTVARAVAAVMNPERVGKPGYSNVRNPWRLPDVLAVGHGQSK
ncbi:hypothetical protein ABIA39_007893 [Nocardia sp. GAS34]|uniref:HIT family protein n=1 Tax=Nocardia sp. GAS34 TaxID=3156305 RepID=UPI003D1CECF2